MIRNYLSWGGDFRANFCKKTMGLIVIIIIICNDDDDDDNNSKLCSL